jgi:hypothetical protein
VRRALAAAIGCLLALPLSCGETEQLSGEAEAPLHRYGISVEVPAGWDAAITRGALRAANFPLPSPPGRPLAEGELLLQLFETDVEADSPPADRSLFPSLEEVPTLTAEDFNAPEPGVEQVAGLARRTFSLSGRLFVLFAASGAEVPAPAALAELDDLLASIAVEDGDFYEGSVDPPRFAPREGWDVGDSGPRPVGADGNFVSAWASTIPFRDAWNEPHADETVGVLPEDGIVIWVGLVATNRFTPRGRHVTLPVRLADFERHAAWEGQIRDLPQYVLRASKAGEYELELRVFFGRPTPTPELADEADAMLARLRLPDWPRWDS